MKLYETDGHCAAFTATVLTSERMPNDPKYIMRLRSRLRPEVR